MRNFALAAREWFQKELAEFDLHLMPLTFISLPTSVTAFLLNVEERNFLSYLNEFDQSDRDPDSLYSIALNIEVNYSNSKAKGASPISYSTDPSATPIYLTEEQIRVRYPWNYRILTDRCKSRYADFKVNQIYHDVRKRIQDDQRFAMVRYLDPEMRTGTPKVFFNPNILNELDKHYTRN